MAGNESAVFADPAQDGLENPQALTNPHTPLFSGPLHLGLRGRGTLATETCTGFASLIAPGIIANGIGTFQFP
jgi:hypothetical protein